MLIKKTFNFYYKSRIYFVIWSCTTMALNIKKGYKNVQEKINILLVHAITYTYRGIEKGAIDVQILKWKKKVPRHINIIGNRYYY